MFGLERGLPELFIVMSEWKDHDDLVGGVLWNPIFEDIKELLQSVVRDEGTELVQDDETILRWIVLVIQEPQPGPSVGESLFTGRERLERSAPKDPILFPEHFSRIEVNNNLALSLRQQLLSDAFVAEPVAKALPQPGLQFCYVHLSVGALTPDVPPDADQGTLHGRELPPRRSKSIEDSVEPVAKALDISSLRLV